MAGCMCMRLNQQQQCQTGHQQPSDRYILYLHGLAPYTFHIDSLRISLYKFSLKMDNGILHVIYGRCRAIKSYNIYQRKYMLNPVHVEF